MTPLHEWMPSFDVAARHSIDVAAPAGRTYEVARTVPLGSPWLVRVLMGLRALPALAARAFSSHTPRAASADRHPRDPAGIPFTLLGEEPGSEFVLGLAGRFWTPSGGLVSRTADSFKLPPDPGLAQAVWNFQVEPRAGGCRVTTETRVRCADAATRAHFLRYWRVVRFGSGAIRLSILREIRRQAEADPVRVTGPSGS
ncbi:MAG: hypothetical protein H0X67_17220 [Acidobacteria bacterium]|nr:hypothetical protein [Acidobacteriota bacterium]